MIVVNHPHFYNNPFAMKPTRNILLVFLLLLTACVVPIPAQSITPTPKQTNPEQIPKSGQPFAVKYHPDGPLYVGDQVSIEVLSPPNFTGNNQSLRVSFNSKTLGEANFGHFGIGGRQQATFYWVWDTRGLKSGTHTLKFSVLPSGSVWTERVSLHPAEDVPLPEPSAHWVTVETVCCAIHYVSGTDAERDINTLKTMADAQAADVSQRLGEKLKTKIPLTFLPRTLGQGGFASNGIYVSYLDRNYAGSSAQQIIHHEMVHWIDMQMGVKTRISMLQEGFAVYFSDGHFKVESIPTRAAALIQMERYIPLPALVNSFYSSQHEIGYIEAGALIGYLIKTYGRQKFDTFYRSLPPMNGPDSDILNAGLKKHYNISLDQLEIDFTRYLRQQTVTENDITDMHLTIVYYDTVRRYQQALDPSAHFMTAWLPNGDEMRERKIVADYLRHPTSSPAKQIEELLVLSDKNLRAGNYKASEDYINLVNLLLDVLTKRYKN